MVWPQVPSRPSKLWEPVRELSIPTCTRKCALTPPRPLVTVVAPAFLLVEAPVREVSLRRLIQLTLQQVKTWVVAVIM